MTRMTIYLDADTQKAVEAAAAREELPVSHWAREHLREAAGNALRPHSLDSFYGAIADDSFREPDELPSQGDGKRLTFD
ncbi:MAG TPA: hypothetical protein VIS74_05040 [Chthoniobacterales bacterium]